MPKSKSRKRASRKSAQQIDVRVNVVSIIILLASIASGVASSAAQKSPHGIITGVVLGIILMQSPKVARQWERAVVLRLGKYQGLRGPGLFWIVPFIDTVTAWIDQRVITTNFNAEETLTSDTVPVNVDAVL
ncbi:MAG TPA: SPFH domain-containing protein, partial [Gemmatimonadaceae bacterium]|nr:SPFH domain-containing protein [Gemmatimonadaceae bacterium]